MKNKSFRNFLWRYHCHDGYKDPARRDLEEDLLILLKNGVFAFFIIATLQLCVSVSHYKSVIDELSRDSMTAKQTVLILKDTLRTVHENNNREKEQLKAHIFLLKEGVKSKDVEFKQQFPEAAPKINPGYIPPMTAMQKEQAQALAEQEVAKAESIIESHRAIAAKDRVIRKEADLKAIKLEIAMKDQEALFKRKYLELKGDTEVIRLKAEKARLKHETAMRIQLTTMNTIIEALTEIDKDVDNLNLSPEAALKRLKDLRKNIEPEQSEIWVTSPAVGEGMSTGPVNHHVGEK